MNTFDKFLIAGTIIICLLLYAGYKFFSNPDNYR